MAGLEMRYFILKPRSKYRGDPFAVASRRAMLAYADALKDTGEHADLVRELEAWSNDEAVRDARMEDRDFLLGHLRWAHKLERQRDVAREQRDTSQRLVTALQKDAQKARQALRRALGALGDTERRT